MRAYLRYSPRTFHDKVVVDGYPPAAFAAFNAVLCLAEEQPERGRFRSERLLRLLLDEPEEGVRLGWGKWVKYLMEHGDLVRRDGALYVVGWDEWQEGDFTVAERVARLRRKRREGNGGATEDVTVPEVITPSEAVGGKPKAVGGRRKAVPPPPAVTDQTDDGPVDTWLRIAGTGPSPKARIWMAELGRAHGQAAVSAAMVAEWDVNADRKTLLSRAQARLERGGRQADRDREAAERAAAAAERARVEAMPAEQRAENMKRLRDQMVASGLVPAEGNR